MLVVMVRPEFPRLATKWQGLAAEGGKTVVPPGAKWVM